MNPYDAVVLINGAATDLGAATAEAFDRGGAKVALAGLPENRLQEVAGNINDALVLPTDVAKPEAERAAVERTVERFGRIDVLVNFVLPSGLLRSESLTAADVRGAIEVNLVGPLAATQAAARVMHAQGRGHIVNVGFPGYLLGVPMMAPYAASAAAVSGWTRAMQAEWAGSGVEVTEFFLGRVARDHEPGARPDDPDDVFSDPAQSPLVRLLVQEQPLNTVAKAIVDAIRTPSGTEYSSAGVRVLSLLGLFARLRVFLGAKMADGQRLRTGGVVFGKPTSLENRAGAAAPESRDEPTPQAPPEAEAQPEPVSAASKPAAKKRAAKKTGAAKKAAKKTTKKKAAKKVAKKTTTKRSAAKKAVALSPEATARVKAAAERAAASAKGSDGDGEEGKS